MDLMELCSPPTSWYFLCEPNPVEVGGEGEVGVSDPQTPPVSMPLVFEMTFAENFLSGA